MLALTSEIIKNSTDSEEIQPYFEKYWDWIQSIKLWGLWEIQKAKPLLDGNQACDLLKIPKGKMLKKVLDDEMDWQYMHPEGTREELEQFLLTHKDKYI